MDVLVIILIVFVCVLFFFVILAALTKKNKPQPSTNLLQDKIAKGHGHIVMHYEKNKKVKK